MNCRAISVTKIALVSLIVLLVLPLSSASGGPQTIISAGKTIDSVYDGSDVQKPNSAYEARFFLPKQVLAEPTKSWPMFVFLHGTNPDFTRFRMVGGRPQDPDVREVIGRMIDEGLAPPMIVAAPTTTVSCHLPETMWPSFDLDRFVERAVKSLRGQATIDLNKIVIMGHSGGACNLDGGIFHALEATTLSVKAVFATDTCMDAPYIEKLLSISSNKTAVYATWQQKGWQRKFDQYKRIFQEKTSNHQGSARVAEEMAPAATNPHNGMVEETLRKYLRDAIEKNKE